MRTTIQFSVFTFGEEFRYSCEMPNLLVRASEQIASTDVPVLGAFPELSGEHMADSTFVNNQLEFRKDAAELLSKQIAEMLLEYMAEKDTFNGYSVKRLDR